MPKLQLNATELVGTDVDFVALVKRGANRLPFRITKEDTSDMLDLHKIGRSMFAKSDNAAAPQVVAAIIAPGADTARVAALFKSAGLDPKTFVKTVKDGITTVAKADADKAEGSIVLKLDEHVALVVSGLKKSFDSYGGNTTDFTQMMATEGVYPAMSAASDALDMTISNILFAAQSPEDASAQIAKACDAYKGYVTGMLGGVPIHAFKMDVAVRKAAKKEVMKPSVDDAAAAAQQDTTLPAVPALSAAEGNSGTDADAAATAKVKKDQVDLNQVADDSYVAPGPAGVNGTGAGFAASSATGTGTTPAATTDDKADVPSTLGITGSGAGSTTGNTDEGPAGVKGGVKKDGLPAGTKEPEGFLPGDDDGFAASATDSTAANARGTADDKKVTNTTGGTTTGSTIPDGDSGITVHKDGEMADGDVGKKGKGKTLPDSDTGAGAPSGVGQDFKDISKADLNAILQAIAGVQKSVDDRVGEVRKEVGTLSGRLGQVEERTVKAEAAMNGTVFAEPSADQPVRARKGEGGENVIPLLDTAYARQA